VQFLWFALYSLKYSLKTFFYVTLLEKMFKDICEEDVESWAAKDCPPPKELVEKARECLSFEYAQNDLERYDQVVKAWSNFSGGKDLDLTQVYDDVLNLPNIFAAALTSQSISKSVQDILNRDNVFSPRISSKVCIINEVLEHFQKNKPVSIRVLTLYCKKLGVSRAEVLALLSSGPDFYSMPSEAVSFVRGRPCRVRTKEHFKISKNGKSWKNPTVLISSGNLLSMYRENKLVAQCTESGFIAPFPTDNKLEQVVFCVNPTGKACLITTTANSLRKIVDFEVPMEGPIDWVDVRKDTKCNILYWGGTDHMLGGSLWQYCLGVDDDLNFFEISAERADKVCEIYAGQDFTIHGNVLTVHRIFQDVEDEVRKYKGSSFLLCNDGVVSDYGVPLIDAWGTPQNYVLLLENCMRTYTEKDMLETEVHVDRDASICVLYAHSR